MNSALERFKNTLVYEHTDSIAALRADLQRIHELDKEKEGKSGRAWWIIGFGALAGIGGLIGMTVNSLLAIPAIAGGIMFVTGIILKIVHGKLDVDDARYEIADGLLDMLALDSAPDSSVQLRVDFQNHSHESKFKRAGKSGAWDVKYYVDPCISLRGRLLDGVRYSVTVTQKLQKRSKWKTNPRGKTKHKSKSKACAELQVVLRFKPEKFPAFNRIADKVQGSLRMPRGQAVKDLQVTENQVSLQLRDARPTPDEQLHVGLVLEALTTMFLGLYQGLNVARAIQRREKKESEA